MLFVGHHIHVENHLLGLCVSHHLECQFKALPLYDVVMICQFAAIDLLKKKWTRVETLNSIIFNVHIEHL